MRERSARWSGRRALGDGDGPGAGPAAAGEGPGAGRRLRLEGLVTVGQLTEMEEGERRDLGRYVKSELEGLGLACAGIVLPYPDWRTAPEEGPADIFVAVSEDGAEVEAIQELFEVLGSEGPCAVRALDDAAWQGAVEAPGAVVWDGEAWSTNAWTRRRESEAKFLRIRLGRAHEVAKAFEVVAGEVDALLKGELAEAVEPATLKMAPPTPAEIDVGWPALAFVKAASPQAAQAGRERLLAAVPAVQEVSIVSPEEMAGALAEARLVGRLPRHDGGTLCPVDELVRTSSKAAEAARLKALGNEAFLAGNFGKASRSYTEAILLDPDGPAAHILYSNRSAAFAGNELWDMALEDAADCVRLAPRFAKGYCRRAQALEGLGRIKEAERELLTAVQLDEKFRSNLDLLRQTHKKVLAWGGAENSPPRPADISEPTALFRTSSQQKALESLACSHPGCGAQCCSIRCLDCDKRFCFAHLVDTGGHAREVHKCLSCCSDRNLKTHHSRVLAQAQAAAA